MKKIIMLLLVAVMVFGLVACGTSSSDEPAKQAGEDASTDSTDGGEIPTVTLLTFTEWYKSGWEALVAYIDENAEDLGFRLEVQQIAGGVEGQDLLKAKFATDELPDLLQSYGAKWLNNDAGVLDKMVVLDGIDMSDYDETTLAEGGYIFNGKLYGVPCDSASLVTVVYNKDVFAAAGIDAPPSNYEEFIAACEKINAAGVTPMYYSGADAWTLGCFCHFGFNQDVVESGISLTEFWNEMNTNQRHYSEAENFLSAIETCKAMVDMGYVNESYLSDTYDMAQTAIAEGTAAMYVNGTWVYDEIANKYPESADKIGAFALPLFDDNYLNSSLPSAIGMTTGCKDQELGMKVMEFLASAEAQQVYATAQPGIYLNKRVTCEVSDCYQDCIDLVNSGKSMALWQNMNLYGYGDFAGYVQDYLAGGMSAQEVLELLDSETANNAIAAGSEDWAE